MDLFENVEVSSMLVVEDYKVSQAHNKPLGYGISLNPSNPKASVRLLPEADEGGSVSSPLLIHVS